MQLLERITTQLIGTSRRYIRVSQNFTFSSDQVAELDWGDTWVY